MFQIIRNGKALTPEQFKLIHDDFIKFFNREISKKAFYKIVDEKLKENKN